MIFGRRSFLTLASGLLVPYEPERVYSFLPAWRLVDRAVFEEFANGARIWIPSGTLFSDTRTRDWSKGYSTFRASIHDINKSGDAYGIPVPWV